MQKKLLTSWPFPAVFPVASLPRPSLAIDVTLMAFSAAAATMIATDATPRSTSEEDFL